MWYVFDMIASVDRLNQTNQRLNGLSLPRFMVNNVP